MLRVIILVCLAVQFTASKKLHEYMTPDEIMGIFQTPLDKVPDYDVVPVLHTMHRRSPSSSHEMQLKAFDQDVRLYLTPTEGVLVSQNTPLWTARSDRRALEGIHYDLFPNAMLSLGHTYHDVDNTAAVLMNPIGYNTVLIDGTIGPGVVIRSLPTRIVRDVMYGSNGLFEPHHEKNVTMDDDLAYTYHHIVYKSPELKGDQYTDFKIENPPGIFRSLRHKRSLPDVIYPEVLVIVDYHEYTLLGRNIEQAKRYIISFWNGVDLRYRLLTTPRIRFNIAGIIIALDAGATPYLERNRRDTVAVDADRALYEMGDYFYREPRFPMNFFDMAVAMTQLDMCNMIDDEFCDTGTLGYAFVAGACDRNDTKKSSEAVGIVEDNGGFSGIIPAAHEVGHLIGARHDGNPKTAGECPAYEGYIMTDGLLLHEHGFEWSNCSINAFYTFLNQDRARCLYDKPLDGIAVPRILPGKMMDLDLQCKKALGTRACYKDETVCTRLECLMPGSGTVCRAVAPAAEGSSCGDGLFCLNGKCVLEGTETKNQGSKFMQMFTPYLQYQIIRPIWL